MVALVRGNTNVGETHIKYGRHEKEATLKKSSDDNAINGCVP